MKIITRQSLLAGCAVCAIAATMGAGSAFAQFANGCGGTAAASATGGAPSISASEISTSQALELIRQRRVQVAEVCPVGLVNVGGTCQPIQTVSASATPPPATPAAQQQAIAAAPPAAAATAQASKAGPAQPAGKPKAAAPKQAAVATEKPAAVSAPEPSAYRSLKDDFVQEPPSRITGAWAETFVDLERHANINGGQGPSPTRTQRTVGALAGVDWSVRTGGGVPQGQLFGLFAGYQHIHSHFSDASFTGDVFPIAGGGAGFRTIDVAGAEQTLQGGSVGLYTSFFLAGLSGDLTYKADFFDLDRSGLSRERVFSNGCGGGFVPMTLPGGGTALSRSLDASTRLTDHTIALNGNYRLELGNGWWMEPTAGVRFTYSDFDNDASALGLADGRVLRIQGGLRFGTATVVSGGHYWTTTLTGLLYSDVLIDGYVANSFVPGLPATVANADEGKLRALGMVQTRLLLSSGLSYYGQLELRGGEDMIGGGGRVGIRYEW